MDYEIILLHKQMSQKLKFLIAILIFIPSLLSAKVLNSIRRDLESDLSRLGFVVGADFESNAIHRGALIYEHPVVHPVGAIYLADRSQSDPASPALFFRPHFDLSIEEFAAGIQFSKEFGLRAGAKYFSGSELIHFFGEALEKQKGRPYSIEAFGEMEYRPCRWFSSSAAFMRDLNQHHGNYFPFATRLSLWTWSYRGSDFLGLWLQGELGLGDSAHNRYLYGAGAESGWSDYGGILGIELSKLFWDLRSEISIAQRGLLGSNRNADRVHGQADNLIFSLSLQRSFQPF